MAHHSLIYVDLGCAGRSLMEIGLSHTLLGQVSGSHTLLTFPRSSHSMPSHKLEERLPCFLMPSYTSQK